MPMIRVLVRRTSSAFLLATFCLIAFECLALVAYSIVNRELFSYEVAFGRVRTAARSDTDITIDRLLRGHVKVLHPYLGYVYDASKRDYLHAGIAISDYGFPDDNALVQRHSEDKLIIGVLGGSVAWWFQSLGRKTFEAELRKVPSLRAKEFIFVRMALGGFKQPQQLMAYAYALSLGGHFDILINLDGFNEIALYSLGTQVNPTFPYEWQTLASSTVHPDEISHVGRLKVLEQERAKLAAALSTSPLRFSIAVNVLWQLADRYLQNGVERARHRYSRARLDGQNLAFAITGPPFEQNSQALFYSRLADVWARSSIAIDALSKAHDVQYFHFLQPSQYVADSKLAFSEKERASAYDPNSAWAAQATVGYPALIEAGNGLRAAGINYHDLTPLFLNESGTMYEDACCHLSKVGNEVLGHRIGALVARSFATKAPR